MRQSGQMQQARAGAHRLARLLHLSSQRGRRLALSLTLLLGRLCSRWEEDRGACKKVSQAGGMGCLLWR